MTIPRKKRMTPSRVANRRSSSQISSRRRITMREFPIIRDNHKVLILSLIFQSLLTPSLAVTSSLKNTKQTLSAAFVEEEEDNTAKPPFRPYKLLDSEEIVSTLLDWKTQFSDFIEVYTAQDSFGLGTAGRNINLDCPFDTEVEGCLNYYAVIADRTAHPPHSQSWNRLPTVLLSGELHGNERVGPTTVMETTRLLLEAATCQAQPPQDRIRCTTHLQTEYGTTKPQQEWLGQLVRTRRIIVVPTANALGYYRNSRMEDRVDPNRDFPYDQLPGNHDRCMQSIAARTLNELFRYYLIMNSFTFHGGTELLGYEWGNPSHYSSGGVSPDDIAQDQLARTYAKYGGSFDGSNGRPHPEYLYGDMNSIIYHVRGGFDDFAYAGSWDTQNMISCDPTTYGGYNASQTIYDDGMLRSFNMLVETSYRKTPDENDLGTTWHVLNENSSGDAPPGVQRQRDLQEQPPKGRYLRGGTYWPYTTPRDLPMNRLANGHIPRNLRLALASIDMVQPYLSITKINDLALGENSVLPPKTPASSHTHRTCSGRNLIVDSTQRLIERAMETKALPLFHVEFDKNIDAQKIRLEWTVGGAMSIDHTYLWIAGVGESAEATGFLGDTTPLADASSWLDEYVCGDPFTEKESQAQRLDPSRIKQIFQSLGNPQQGSGFFSPSGSRPTLNDTKGIGPVFSADVNLQALPIEIGSMLVVMASTRVDSEWAKLPTDALVSPQNTGPQSHMVQSRTNSSWFYENAQGHIIQGQSEFFSRPVLIQLVADASVTGSGTQLVNNRYHESALVQNENSLVSRSGFLENGEETQEDALSTFAPSGTEGPTETVAPTEVVTYSATTSWTDVPTVTGTTAPTEIVAIVSKASVEPPPSVRSSFADVLHRSQSKMLVFDIGEKQSNEGENKRRHLQQPHLEEKESYVTRRAPRLKDHLPQKRP